MSELLGLDGVPGVVVLDGRIQPLEGGRADAGKEGVPTRSATTGSVLRDRLAHAIHAVRPALADWVRAHGAAGSRATELGRIPKVKDPQVAAQIECFIHACLVPRLRQEEAGPSPETPRPARFSPADFVASRMERFFAFSGRCWHGLVPFWGRPEPRQFHLQIGDDQFLGVRTEPCGRVLARYDALLQEGVRREFSAPPEAAAGQYEVYRDAIYSVICAPHGRYVLCRRLAPYVIEGEDQQLYYFDAVELGLPLGSVEVSQVVRPHVVRVMHPYKHMFVHRYDAAQIICMPRSETYYSTLHQLPLEEALLRHLESARLTLCAGYTPAVSAFHPIGAVSRRVVSPEEALARGLPVYRYHRGRSAN